MSQNIRAPIELILWSLSLHSLKCLSSLLNSQYRSHLEKIVISDLGKILKQLPYVLFVCALSTDWSSCLTVFLHILFPHLEHSANCSIEKPPCMGQISVSGNLPWYPKSGLSVLLSLLYYRNFSHCSFSLCFKFSDSD